MFDSMWNIEEKGEVYSESESTLELQSRVAQSMENVTTNMVPTQKTIPEESGWKKNHT